MSRFDSTALKFAWFSPSRGDADWAGAPAGMRDRRDGMGHLLRVAQQAEANGFDSILIPVCDECVDPCLVASAILHQTTRLETIVAARALASNPGALAKAIVTLSWQFPRRVALNLVAGNPAEAAPEVCAWSADKRERYFCEAAAVVAALIRSGTWQSQQVEFFPTYLTSGVQDIAHAPSDLILGGHSCGAFAAAAAYYDYLFMFADSPAVITRKIHTAMSHEASTARRHALRFGMGVNIICRATREEAVRIAQETLRQIGHPQRGGEDQSLPADDKSYFVTDTLWTGLSAVRKGPIATIVGNYDEVAAALLEYGRAGVTYFSLTGHPYYGEAERVGQEILPRLRALRDDGARQRHERHEAPS